MEAIKGRLAYTTCRHMADRMADRMAELAAFHTSLEPFVVSWILSCGAYDLSCSLVGTLRITSSADHLSRVRCLGGTPSTDTHVVACSPPSSSRLVTVSPVHFAP